MSEVGAAAVYKVDRSGFTVTYDGTNFPTDRDMIGSVKYVHVVYDETGLLGHTACSTVIEDPCIQTNIQLDIETAEATSNDLSPTKLTTPLFTKLEMNFIDSDDF